MRSEDRAIWWRECHGGGSVMVWEGICRQERTSLVLVNGNLTAQCYIDEILCPTILPFLQNQPRGSGVYFMSLYCCRFFFFGGGLCVRFVCVRVCCF